MLSTCAPFILFLRSIGKVGGVVGEGKLPFANKAQGRRMMMEDKKYEGGCGSGCKHIKGIKCNVQNCYYHDCDTYCTAKEIAVGPNSAHSSGETLCATFKPKEN